MAFIEIETIAGTQKVRVCDYCKTVCIPPGSKYCSGHCARADAEFYDDLEASIADEPESSYDANDGTEGSN